MSDTKFCGYGGKEIIERVIGSSGEAKKRIEGLERVAVGGRIARECIDIAYGFFSPLEGFMVRADVESVCEKVMLSNGVLWPIPIVLDISNEQIEQKQIKEGQSIVLTYNGAALAVMDVEEIFCYDKAKMAEAVVGTRDEKHPGVKMMKGFEDTFVGGKVTLVESPRFNQPFDKFWYTPRRLREKFRQKGWERVVAHQSRNVPHSGHEWLMKGAWFSAHGDNSVEQLRTGILVSCIIGPKRIGDYIDEAIVLGHQQLHESGYFRDDIHMVSFVMWDMRYAGPKEAILHAIIRENLGCTHHMFGRDHAGVGTYYGAYDAHRIFDEVGGKSLNIRPVRVLEWWYCPVCGEVTYSGLCGHTKQKQAFSGTMIRSMVQDKVKPTKLIFRPEVFDKLMDSAERYGFGSPFCNEKYLAERQPVFELSGQ